MPMSRFLAPFGASRTPARWGDPFVDLQREVNRVFDDVFRGFGMTPSGEDGTATVAPRIDIDETDQAIEVSAELPGVKQDEVDVSLDDDVLTIRGEKRCERKDERARVSERFYGTFQRAIQLPFTPNPDQVQAQFDNGILKITLPKQEQAQRTHKIQVAATHGGQAKQAGGTQGGQDQTSQGQTNQGQGTQGASTPPRGAVE
jgi:HSP20 family protein